MDNDEKHDKNEVAPHRWISNPLDWSHIDRMILLTGMTTLTPLALGGSLLFGTRKGLGLPL